MAQIPQLQELIDDKTVVFSLQKRIVEIIEKKLSIQIGFEEIELSQTLREEFGDYTTNVALKIAKTVGKQPREIAEEIVRELDGEKIQKTEVAGPGFINIYLKNEFFLGQLQEIIIQGDKYGSWELSNEQVMVEFGQPNTHKAFHVGHLKSVITGLSIVKLIENLGFEVIKVNYFGDIGMHVAKSVWGFIKKGEPENFDRLDSHDKMKFLDACYTFGANEFKVNPKAEKEIREINTKIYQKSDDELLRIYLQTRQLSLEHQADIFKRLGIIFDRQYPESEIFEHSMQLIKENLGKIFIEDQEAIIFPGEKYGLNRWVFITKEGNPTYSGKDLGLAYKKFKEFPNLFFSIVTTSIEVNDYFKAVIKALELIDKQFTGRYFHIGFGWLLRNNKKTSSRMGDSIKGIDILNEASKFSKEKISSSKKYTPGQAEQIGEAVAIAGLKFLILSHELQTDINYDPEQFLNPEGFSGPYILYGYVRAKSILRQDLNHKFRELSNKDIDLTIQEHKLIKLLSQFPGITLDAGKTLSPHKVANYLFELTQTFNYFYKENKVLVEDEIIRNFRLTLTQGVSIVLKNGLELLGIETIENM